MKKTACLPTPVPAATPSIAQQYAKPRGFAALRLQRRREIASAGGIAAHQKGTAHEFTSEEARAANRKGGRGRPKDLTK